MQPQHRRHLSLAAVLVSLVAACGSSPTSPPSPAVATPPPATQSAQPTSPPSALPSVPPSASLAPTPGPSLPPPSATITFTGGVTGVSKGIQVNCNNPSLAGLTITLFGATTRTGVATTISLSAGSVAVTLDSGSGSTFAAREFTGLGVTDFDATKGAMIDSPLTEVTTSSQPGKLPAISAIKGRVDCGNQVPGTSTLMLNGLAAGLAVSGPIDPIRVDCNPNAKPATVHAVGLTS